MKTLHDMFGEYRAANKRRNRAYRDRADDATLVRIEMEYWAKRELLRSARSRRMRVISIKIKFTV